VFGVDCLFFYLFRFAQQFKSLLRDQVVQSHLEMLHQSQQDRCVIDQKMTDIVSQENAENEEGILGETLEEIFESYEKWIASVSSVVESILAFEFTGSFDTVNLAILSWLCSDFLGPYYNFQAITKQQKICREIRRSKEPNHSKSKWTRT
jgi:hypothetical protein